MVNPVTKKDRDETVKAVKDAQDENKRIQAKFQKASTDLEGAIQDKNDSMIALYRPPLEKVAREIANCIKDVELAIALVKGLQEDEGFMEKSFDLVEKLLASVTKIRTLLTKQLVESKKLEQEAVDALSKLDGDQEDAVSEYARLEDVANDLEARVDHIRPQVLKHNEAGMKAFGMEDQPALKEALNNLLDLKVSELLLVAVTNRPKVQAFQKKYPNSALKAEATWLHDKLEKLRGELEKLESKVREIVRASRFVKAEASTDAKPDVAKAAKALGISGKDQPKLAKVLAGKPTAYERALADLAEELELEERNGKKLVARLEKAKALAS